MSFDRLFKTFSYAAVFCGFLSLWISGAFGVVGVSAFLLVFVLAWFLEGGPRQVSERLGTALIVLTLPAYYFAYRFNLITFATSEAKVAGVLARLIATLTAIKLLQRKSDRDWVFLYLMAFFEILLAAGLSISTFYLLSFVAFLAIMAGTVILFEVRKTEHTISSRLHAENESARGSRLGVFPAKRLPAAAIGLIVVIAAVALPLFFFLPRAGGAGFGGSSGGVSAKSGFSDTVRLGGVGSIQQNEEVVMRIRIESPNPLPANFKWRGLALDTFTGRAWSRSVGTREPRAKGERDLIQVDYATGRDSLVMQTVYLEPLDTPVLFAMPRVVGFQTGFPFVYRDAYGAVTAPRSGERISYRALSDADTLPENELRQDRAPNPGTAANYLQLPDSLDPRIVQLAASITANTGNRYDAARSIESYLQNEFGYTLDQKAGGDDPLSDFLFNVREGHCEYFATSMAIMLRTQGVATRVVNGFQRGEFNETAGVYIVRQRNAHSWVEVYFPGEERWVSFDPTPPAAQNLTDGAAGITKQLNSYLEALEMFWIQYFVAFDSQEQRTLFTSIRRGISDYNMQASSWTDGLAESAAGWWRQLRGDEGLNNSLAAAGKAAALLLAVIAAFLAAMWSRRKIVRSKFWAALKNRIKGNSRTSIVDFYERMQMVLASKGIVRPEHQTPLEFAFELNSPAAVRITEKYNRVRFGDSDLQPDEADAIEEWLAALKNDTGNSDPRAART